MIANCILGSFDDGSGIDPHFALLSENDRVGEVFGSFDELPTKEHFIHFRLNGESESITSLQFAEQHFNPFQLICRILYHAITPTIKRKKHPSIVLFSEVVFSSTLHNYSLQSDGSKRKRKILFRHGICRPGPGASLYTKKENQEISLIPLDCRL